MSTRANIRFKAGEDVIHIDRSHDGFPKNVLEDIKEAIALCKGRWSGAELGQLVSAFLGMRFNPNKRIQEYEPCIGYETAGDESYLYHVTWIEDINEYSFGLLA